jgi:DNA-directed RNA polymerase subunit RPC12/RpoP
VGVLAVTWDSAGKEESKMKINCLGCGYKVDLAGGYDDYVGQIKCFACGAIMEIATQGGNIRAVESVTGAPRLSAEEVFEQSLG